METIELPPTWSGVIEIYIMAIEHGTAKGKEAAKQEIRRLARNFDALIAERNKEAK